MHSTRDTAFTSLTSDNKPKSLSTHSEGFSPPQNLRSISEASVRTTDDGEELEEIFSHSEDNSISDSAWYEYEDVLVHKENFLRGLTVIKPVGSHDETIHHGKITPISSNTHEGKSERPRADLTIKDRKIYFSKFSHEPNASAEKAIGLLSQLNRFAKAKHDIYLVNDISQLTIMNTFDFAIVNKPYFIELYYKNAADQLALIPISRPHFIRILSECNINEVIKKVMPCKLCLTQHTLDLFERQVLAYRKNGFIFCNEAKLEEVPDNCAYIFEKGKTLYYRNKENVFQKLKMLPVELNLLLNNINIKTNDTATLSLTTYQLEKLETLTTVLSRTVYMGSQLPDTAMADLCLIKKPVGTPYYLPQIVESKIEYLPVDASNVDTAPREITLPSPCYLKENDQFIAVNLNSADDRKKINKLKNPVLYTEQSAGGYAPLDIEPNKLKEHINSDRVTLFTKNSDGASFLPASVWIKDIKKQLGYAHYELYEKNNTNQYVCVDISSARLKHELTQLGLRERFPLNTGYVVPLQADHLIHLDSLVNLHSAVTAYNQRRKEEVFVSVPSLGLYVQPWLSHGRPPERLKQFKKFHTVGCLFGSTLKGINQKKHKFPMVKHDIAFYQDEIIESVSFNHKAPNPYEEMLFNELEKIARFINLHADPLRTSDQALLSYHLPYIDYVLFGLNLLAIGRISLDALEALFIQTFYQKEKHINEIKKIFSMHNVSVDFESPFENLFDLRLLEQAFKLATTKTTKSKPGKHAFARAIFRMLGILDSSEKSIAMTVQSPEELTQHLIQLLTTNQYNLIHKRIWIDCIEAVKSGVEAGVNGFVSPTIIEDIFEIGNSAMMGLLAQAGTQDFETCSILPASEKQIQVYYNKLIPHLPKEDKESHNRGVVNMTFIPTAVCADNTDRHNIGLFFYYAGDQAESIAKAMRKLKKHTETNQLVYAMSKTKKQGDVSEEFITLEKALPQVASLVYHHDEELPTVNNNQISRYTL